jgi:hypothetical protein
VRLRFLTSASSAMRSGESGARGGPGRNWLGDVRMKVFHSTSSTPTGFAPFQYPGPEGMLPDHFVSGSLAYAIACSATFRPNSRPACASLGNATPARTLLRDASSAAAATRCASWGYTCAMIAAAAPAATECSHGKEGLRGTATATGSVTSRSLGRCRLWVFFESHATVRASSMATFNSEGAQGRAARNAVGHGYVHQHLVPAV